MMGMLGNARRGGRSPTLFVVALAVCVLLFSLNYWLSSSRNIALQARLLELEEAMQRVSAERAREKLGRSEAEEQVRRQTHQLALMEGAHRRRQQTAENRWKEEKEDLLLNISSSVTSVQEMKNQMNSLRKDLSKVQEHLQSCQANMNTLNKKLTYDTTQCHTQILAQKEECNEKIAAAKLEVQKKYEKEHSAAAAAVDQPAVVSKKRAAPLKPNSEVPTGNNSAKGSGQPQEIKPAPRNKPKPEEHLENNEIPEDETVPKTDGLEKNLPPNPFLPSPNGTLKIPPEAAEDLMDIEGGDDAKVVDAPVDGADTKVKEKGAIEYENEGEIEKQLSKLKDEKVPEEELANYNGDEENEPEFEADKQAELAKI